MISNYQKMIRAVGSVHLNNVHFIDFFDLDLTSKNGILAIINYGDQRKTITQPIFSPHWKRHVDLLTVKYLELGVKNIFVYQRPFFNYRYAYDLEGVDHRDLIELRLINAINKFDEQIKCTCVSCGTWSDRSMSFDHGKLVHSQTSVLPVQYQGNIIPVCGKCVLDANFIFGSKICTEEIEARLGGNKRHSEKATGTWLDNF